MSRFGGELEEGPNEEESSHGCLPRGTYWKDMLLLSNTAPIKGVI